MMNFKGWKKKLKEYITNSLRKENSAHEIALAIAVGTFIAILPSPGLNLILALLALLIIKKMNKWALFATLLFWNPITQIPLVFLSIVIGSLILGYDIPSPLFSFEALKLLTLQYFLGVVILSVLMSVLLYFISRKLIESYRTKHFNPINSANNLLKKARFGVSRLWFLMISVLILQPRRKVSGSKSSEIKMEGLK